MAFDYEQYHAPGDEPHGWDAERSHRWNQLNAAVKADHVLELFKLAHTEVEGVSVLDVGCGDGQVLARLAEYGFGPELVGVEVSETGANLARHQAGISRVATFDGARLPFSDASFSLVLATHVLEHVTDPLGLLLEMRRVAKTFVVVEVPLEDNLAARRPRAVARSRGVGHVQRFSKSDVQRLIADAGLTRTCDLVDPLSRELRSLLDGGARGTAKWAARSVLGLLPHGERLMTVHYAALAGRQDV